MTDIIIVSYKDQLELEQCVTSIRKNCSNYNLFVEDNNPPLPNRGFSLAVNDGIKRGVSPYIWLLNSDAIIKDSMSQQALLERFSYGTQVGIVGSMQIDYDNHNLIRHCGTIKCFPSGSHQGGYISMGHGQIPSKQKWVNFASVMLSREMTEKIGLLDLNMFLLYSDSDYCYVARSRGYECWYEPRSKVFHKLKASKNTSEWHQKDMEAFMKKWGIRYLPEAKVFEYSLQFSHLDMFP
jgi:GT2 family glycosyltransferase